MEVPFEPGPQSGFFPGVGGFVQGARSGSFWRVHGHASVTPLVSPIGAPDGPNTTWGRSLRERILAGAPLLSATIFSYTFCCVPCQL